MDKNSVEYFMTKMTQEEFEVRSTSRDSLRSIGQIHRSANLFDDKSSISYFVLIDRLIDDLNCEYREVWEKIDPIS